MLFSLLAVLLSAQVGAFVSPDNIPKKLDHPAIIVKEDIRIQTKEDTIEKIQDDRHALGHKRWGVDNEHPAEYWYDKRIHTLGNVGFWGAFHASVAPLSTKVIDVLAYDGVDVRKKVADELSKKVKNTQSRVLDLCCGVGISTRALRDAFPDAEAVIGLDTSSEMISMAKFLSGHLAVVKPVANSFAYGAKRMVSKAATFTRGNAERTPFPGQSFDVVTIMYAFHEAPREGRNRILKEAYRLLQPGGTLAVVDICTDYQPSPSMLAGEPYVLEYQKNIHVQLRTFRGFGECTYKTIIPNHVGMWILSRTG